MSISTSQIGELIKVETTYDEQITGEIYCYDKSSSVLVLHILCKQSSKMGVSLTFTEED